ncbi:MAG: RNA polymerase sigma-54 factor, partial [Bauldia sp.]
MALSLKAELRTSQSLVMTPQLMQAIKLLQLSSLDLAAYVDAELERNPLLERAEAEDLAPAAADLDQAGPDVAVEDGNWFETELETSPAAISERLDSDLSNVFPDDNNRAQQEAPPALPA